MLIILVSKQNNVNPDLLLKKTINTFIKKIFLLALPVPAILIFVILWDPFKVFFNYDNYYSNFIVPNRENVCWNLFKKNIDTFHYSNFIIGSSRSQAYKITKWSKIIKRPINKCFHYDGSGLGLFRIKNAIKYLNANTEKIDNLLLILDLDLLGEESNPSVHLRIQPPSVSNESKFTYYSTFIEASLNFKFLLSNLVFKVTGNNYDFMSLYLSVGNNQRKYDKITADIENVNDVKIKTDSIKYYEDLAFKGVFYPRIPKVSNQIIFEKQKEFLSEIKNIVQENATNVKVIISPLYHQVRINNEDLSFLKKIFGSENVFDFSGVNNYTSDYRNFYEETHYKPYVANDIMDFIYK